MQLIFSAVQRKLMADHLPWSVHHFLLDILDYLGFHRPQLGHPPGPPERPHHFFLDILDNLGLHRRQLGHPPGPPERPHHFFLDILDDVGYYQGEESLCVSETQQHSYNKGLSGPFH